ncbi:DNA repair protein rhp41 [Madurella mycetomatis]|uniref:DNA repair protein rhp41 n=1 Tax=Madurella mycetomatis TaxID=100816 RepID=A0A175VWG3_9PEZI|nr:DNA repair protein rhp41 [Madurella mycetomatis]
MVARKRAAPADASPKATRASAASRSATSRSSSRRVAAGGNPAVPDVYREMLVEARAEIAHQGSDASERPLKRKRPGERRAQPGTSKADNGQVAELNKQEHTSALNDDASDDENIEFEDILPPPTVQTITRDSDDDDDDDDDDGDDLAFEEVEIEPGRPPGAPVAEEPKELSLDLSAHMATAAPRRGDRRKAINREQKERRVEIHKLHLLCLLSHVERRNWWCNDPNVQDALRPLLPEKTAALLVPRSTLNQFGRTESLKQGLQEAKEIFRLKFAITERGLRRALWAEDEEQLKNYQLPDEIDSVLEKDDFLEAARTLKGSRDVGAQLFCALLRSAGVSARLVCSLQPLSCVPGAPPMPKQRTPQPQQRQPSKAELYAAAVAKHETKFPEFQASSTTPSPRRRLGHPHAAAYHIPSMAVPSPPAPRPAPSTPKKIRGESAFPVYWVEVLDVAHQKWHPVDALVTHTQRKPRALEPPASDPLNSMSYVVAFDADGSARDVTRRYAKAYNSKTRKMRIDNPMTAATTAATTAGSSASDDPASWWWPRLALRRYTRPVQTDLDQIELNELAADESREPMPRNVADFKDHPVYALERHLRRHEVLRPGAQPAGTVSAGAKAGARLERVYRRQDVRVARTRERWYRLGRVVKDGEEGVKILPKRKGRRKGGRFDGDYGDDGEEEEDDDPDRVGLFGDALGGTPIYMLEQTELYTAPPVVSGRVPKNKFGNVEVYVPSMVPPGGVHITHERAAQAAFILGVDYAPALAGFEFKGRHGTAVLKGVVVPKETEEAVLAVVEGLEDMEAEMERERRTKAALRMWSRLLRGLRIRERVWAGVDETEAVEGEGLEDKGKGKEVAAEEDVGMENAGSDDDIGGGGFFVPDEEDDEGGGGFLVE